MDAIEELKDGSTLEALPLTSADLLDSLENHEDVVSWINDLLDVDDTLPVGTTAQSVALGDLDRRVTQLVGTLELASEDTSTQVERMIDDISRGASRLTYDLHFMREGALSLHSQLSSVESASRASLTADTTAALARLHVLDTARRNMAAARAVLREAESWSTLESDVGSLLGEGAYARAAERLSEAHTSMVVFQNTPEYESRRALLVSLQNQLEAALSSALVAAVNSQDVAVCRNYFSIFCNIQRESEFRNYYYGSRKAGLLEMWQNATLRDCGQDADAGQQTFAQFLPTFFAAFLNVLSTERSSISAIFPDPQPTLSTLITSTLSSLQPSFAERLSAVAGYHGPKALPQLIAAYQATQEFAAATDKILEKIGYAPQAPAAEPDGPPKSHLRRRSSARMSISRRIGPHRASISGLPLLGPGDGALPSWDQELFEPFLDFQNDYGSWERRFLDDVLQGILGEEVKPHTDRSRLLRERSVDVFSAADEAIVRCTTFTHGYASVGLVDALDSLLKTFTEKSKDEITTAQHASTTGLSAAGDLADLDYTPKDWADIQALLHALEAVRALHARTRKFEARLRAALAHTAHALRLAQHHTSGAVRLLAQSALNGMQLIELLERVDPEPQQHALTSPPTDPTARRHLSGNTSQIQPLLPGARTALAAFTTACQRALQTTLLAPLHTRLASYPSLALWTAPADAPTRSGVRVPTFSRSPSAPVQRVAEGLLNLPRLFEVYAHDDALAFSLRTLPFLDPALLAALSAPAPPPEGHRRAGSLSASARPVVGGGGGGEDMEEEEGLEPETVAAAWLGALGRALLAELTGAVLPAIRGLSAGGAAQLAADLGYLASIVVALGIESPELERWRECVEMEDEAGRERWREEGGDEVLGVVARLRGWSV